VRAHLLEHNRFGVVDHATRCSGGKRLGDQVSVEPNAITAQPTVLTSKTRTFMYSRAASHVGLRHTCCCGR
jgi:hypothetical protein